MTTHFRAMLLAGAAAATLMITGAGAAEVRSGYWSVFDTKGDGNNPPLCGMKTEYSDVNAKIMIKYILGDDHLTTHIFKTGWQFPAEPIDLSITVGFNQAEFGRTTARGGQLPDIGAMIEFKIATKATASFLHQFGEAEWMWIRFDDGNEKTWPAKMIGSRNAAKMFTRCITNMIDSRSTQPYSKPQATQPYSKPQATQPFGGAQPKQVRKPKNDDGSI